MAMSVSGNVSEPSKTKARYLTRPGDWNHDEFDAKSVGNSRNRYENQVWNWHLGQIKSTKIWVNWRMMEQLRDQLAIKKDCEWRYDELKLIGWCNGFESCDEILSDWGKRVKTSENESVQKTYGNWESYRLEEAAVIDYMTSLSWIGWCNGFKSWWWNIGELGENEMSEKIHQLRSWVEAENPSGFKKKQWS